MPLKLRADRDARRFLHHLGHWSDDVVVDGHGSLYAVWHLQGRNAEMDDALAVMRRWLADNKALHGVQDPRVEMWDQYTCTEGHPMRVLPECASWFGRLADDAYRTMPANAALNRRDLWFTLVLHRAGGIAGAVGAALTPPRRFVDVDDWSLGEFRDIAAAVDEGLKRYGRRRLGLDRDRPEASYGDGDRRHRRRRGPVRFSEIFEAWHLIANNHFRPIAVSAGPMGRLIVPEAPAFGDARKRELVIPAAEGVRYAAVLSMKDYVEEAWPYTTVCLREMDCPMTLTSAQGFRNRRREINRLTNIFTTSRASEHPAMAGSPLVEAMSKVIGAKDAIESGRALPVRHHWAATIYAPDMDRLNDRVGKATRRLADTGVTVLRQGVAVKAMFHCNVPGNLRWSPCAQKVKSVEAVAFGARINVPPGPAEGKWGAPLLMLKTDRNTEYAYHAHAEGVEESQAEHSGSFQIYGGSGAGKTTLANMMFGVGGQRTPKCRNVCIDSEYGMSAFVEAMGGAYMEFRPGRDAFGLMASLDDTPEDRAHAKQMLRAMAQQTRPGPIPTLDDDRLARGVARQLAMPAHLRSIVGVCAFLPNRPNVDGTERTLDRLRPWCRGERLGWVFDAPRDPIDLSHRIMGFDTTELRKDAEVCGPAVAHLLYRVSKLIDGDPLVLTIDEAQQIQLIPELDAAVQHILATIRKREGIVGLLTQLVETLHSHGAKSAAFRTLIPTSIYFGDENADYGFLVGGRRLTEAEFEVVTEVLPNRAHQFLLKRPGVSMVCGFDLSGAMHVVSVLSAREKTYRLMRELQAEHGRDPEAWVPPFMQRAPLLAKKPLADARAGKGRRAAPAPVPAALPEAAE